MSFDPKSLEHDIPLPQNDLTQTEMWFRETRLKTECYLRDDMHDIAHSVTTDRLNTRSFSQDLAAQMLMTYRRHRDHMRLNGSCGTHSGTRPLCLGQKRSLRWLFKPSWWGFDTREKNKKIKMSLNFGPKKSKLTPTYSLFEPKKSISGILTTTLVVCYHYGERIQLPFNGVSWGIPQWSFGIA